MRARGVHCLVGTSLKRDARRFPLSLCAWEAFPFPFVLGWLTLFPSDAPLPQAAIQLQLALLVYIFIYIYSPN